MPNPRKLFCTNFTIAANCCQAKWQAGSQRDSMKTEVLWRFYAGILEPAIFLPVGRFEAKKFLKIVERHWQLKRRLQAKE